MISSRELARALGVLGCALAVTGLVLTIRADALTQPGEYVVLTGQAVVFGILGAVIVSRQPRNAIGWIFGAVGVLAGLRMLTFGYAEFWLAEGTGPDRLAEIAAVYHSSTWFIEFALPTTFLLLLFPDGRLPGRRWRLIAVCAAGGLLGALLASALVPGKVDGFPEIANPYGINRSVVDVIGSISFTVLAVGIIGSAVSLLVRFRGAAYEQRQQIKLLAVAGAIAAACVLFSYEVVGEDVSSVINPLSIMALPVAAAVAMLRYRLYDMDVVINRALVYGTLTAMLAGTYLASVLLLQLALRTFTEGSGLAVAASTLATAALFRPLRAGTQAVVDRRFFRRKYDAAQTLAAFAARLRDQIDLETLQIDLRAVVAETMQPEHVALWLRTPKIPVTVSGRSSRRQE